MSDSFEFSLHSPLTKEDWDKIADAEYENTTSATFQTPQGRQVRYVKLEVLDKIRAEIESCREDEEPHLCDYRYHRNEGLDMALDIIDKYRESEVE
jgi:hypothetical protein